MPFVLCLLLGFMDSARSYAQGTACQSINTQCLDSADAIHGACAGADNPSPSWIPHCTAQWAAFRGSCQTALSNCSEMFVFPKESIASILYMPPGNKSTVGYSNTASSGTTDTVSQSFSSTTTEGLTFSVAGFSLGGTVAITNSSTSTSTDQTTVQNTESTTWATSGDPIDHTKDVLTIWLNPQITVASYPAPGFVKASGVGFIPTDANGQIVGYTLGNAAYNPFSSTNGSPVAADALANGDMSTINVTVASLQNPTTLLPSELVSRTNSDGSVVPGLLSLCAKRIAESQCTSAAAQSSACGCTVADFSPLVQQDPFFNPAISNPTIASINAADPNNARFVPVLDVNGNDLMLPIQSGLTQNVSLTDAHNTSETYANTVSKTDGISIEYKSSNDAKSDDPLNFDWKDSASVTWSLTESVGTTQGTSHTQSLSLQTTNSNCYEYVNVFEDTVFHTFVFANGSDAPNPCP